jgi:hypothetical protein
VRRGVENLLCGCVVVGGLVRGGAASRAAWGGGCGAEDNHGGLALNTAPWSFAGFRVQILSSP